MITIQFGFLAPIKPEQFLLPQQHGVKAISLLPGTLHQS